MLAAVGASGARSSWRWPSCSAVFLLEYLRARAGNAGFDEVGVVTVAERPTRVIVLAPTLAVCGVLPACADVVSVAGRRCCWR